MKFKAEVLLGGKTATGIEVPEKIVTGFGSGKRPPVRVTIGDHTYRTTVAVMDGRFMIPLSAVNREQAGVAAGDKVTVDIEKDDEPRVVEVPSDFAKALKADKAAKARFDSMSYSHQKQHVQAIEDAKKPETRQRRIDKALEMLRKG